MGAALHRLRDAMPLVVSAVLLTVVVARFEGWPLLGGIDPRHLLAALLLSVALNTTLGALRWWLVIRTAGLPLTYRQVLSMWTGLLPITFFAPFHSGHALYAVALRGELADLDLPEEERTWFRALEVVVYDKLLALASTVLLILVGLYLVETPPPWSTAVKAACVCGLALYAFDRPLARRVATHRWVAGRSRLLTTPIGAGRKGLMLAVGALCQATDIFTVGLVMWGMGLTASGADVLGLFPVIVLAAHLPISFSGLGVREVASAWTLAHVLSYDEAVSIAFAVDAIEYLAPAVFGLVAVNHAWRSLRRAWAGRADPSEHP